MKAAWILGVIVAASGSAIPLRAQAAVEAGLGASRAATMSAPAKNTGGAISRIVEQAEKALGIGGATTPSVDAAVPATAAPARPKSTRPANVRHVAVRATVRRAEPAKPAKPAIAYEDAGGMVIGTEYEEVVRRFGPPTLAITTQPGVQTLRYQSAGAPVKVQMRDGKVAAIEISAPKQP